MKTKKQLILGKMPTGIEGLDEITHGGLPRNRTTLLMGGPGSGKTVLALQTLVNGARQWGEPGIFVAFEENSHNIIVNASAFGWNLPVLEKKELFFLNAQMRPDVVKAGQFDLTGMLAAIKSTADKMGAKRIVFDAIDVLLALLDNPTAERQEVFRLHDWLTNSGLTGIVTFKVDAHDSGLGNRYGFMQFMVDCAIMLNHRIVDQASSRDLRVIKCRGTSFAENEAPLIIGPTGVEVAALSATEIAHVAPTGHISTGVPRLDAMLGGGYYRGASVLITGAPGTAKSTLSGAFAEAACRRKERALYVGFDERSNEIVRNLASVGIHLAPHIQSGRLQMFFANMEASSAQHHLMNIKHLIRNFHPRCLVIDPMSALLKSGGSNIAQGIVERLLQLTKSENITVVFTSLLQQGDSLIQATPVQISTVADTWIDLSYAVRGGERNRALTIVKSRGMKHSNQVRELVLSDKGVTLADVYSAGGEVLMGTQRWQKEQAEQVEEELIHAEVTRKRLEVELAQAELNARLVVLRREVEMKKTELELLLHEEIRREGELARRQGVLMYKRGEDAQKRAAKPRGKTKRKRRA
jgi:circadian clock protein KaiC